MSTLENAKAQDRSLGISIIYWIQQFVLSKWDKAIRNRKKKETSRSLPGLQSYESTTHSISNDGYVASTQDIGQVSSQPKPTRDLQPQQLTTSFRGGLQKLAAKAMIWTDGTPTRIQHLTQAYQNQLVRRSQTGLPPCHIQSLTQLCLMEVQTLKRAKRTTRRKAPLPIYQLRTTLGHVLTLSSPSKLRCIHESPS